MSLARLGGHGPALCYRGIANGNAASASAPGVSPVGSRHSPNYEGAASPSAVS
jgi:hypothetical protein